MVTFNPNSRRHIAHCLTAKYGWEPTELTPSGEAKIDESVLSELEYPEAQKLAEMFLIQKRIAMLAEGSQAWLKKVDDDGRIRHSIISGGTVSGRAIHRNPNLGQVPGQQSKWGKECRELFTVPPEWVLCGSDLSGLELRCLAHYLAPLDGGEYAETILNGDIHTYNQKAAGLPDRMSAKTYIYATLYGGGDRLIGEIVGGKAKDGKRLKANFDEAVPAFKRLKKKLSDALERGHLVGLDGRKLYCRSKHKALSQLLQSAGAVLCKQWLQKIDQRLEAEDLRADAYIVGWIHDEVQIACRNEEVANHVGDISRSMAKEAGRSFSLKIPVEAEYKIGQSWAETH
jgi:DNA polymerase I-like protein with 3'-5' exonuclease and polymerase domains